MLRFLRERRRHEVTSQPFPEAWLGYLQENVPYYAMLAPTEQTKLRDDLRILIAEKNWEGCGGLTLTDEMRVTIAAQASVLLLGLDHDYYPTVESILVYPEGYVAPDRQRGPDGVVDAWPSARLGEAWLRGPIVLSWSDAEIGGSNSEDGHNVVYHEFAHKLDMNDGAADGVPLLHDQAEVEQYASVMSAEFDHLVRHSGQDQAKVLDKYAATNAAEFFAVCTEAFFEKPVRMRDQHPALYRVLRDYYRQDPAGRLD